MSMHAAPRAASGGSGPPLASARLLDSQILPDADNNYRCRYPGCSRMFKMPGALHTHTGWHKRKENIDAGLYDLLGHHLKETHKLTDSAGRTTTLEAYRCDYPGCGKLFQGRGALHTHQGWHKRRPKDGQTFSVHKPNPQREGTIVIETPRKRIRRNPDAFLTGADAASAKSKAAGAGKAGGKTGGKSGGKAGGQKGVKTGAKTGAKKTVGKKSTARAGAKRAGAKAGAKAGARSRGKNTKQVSASMAAPPPRRGSMSKAAVGFESHVMQAEAGAGDGGGAIQDSEAAAALRMLAAFANQNYQDPSPKQPSGASSLKTQSSSYELMQLSSLHGGASQQSLLKPG